MALNPETAHASSWQTPGPDSQITILINKFQFVICKYYHTSVPHQNMISYDLLTFSAKTTSLTKQTVKVPLEITYSVSEPKTVSVLRTVNPQCPQRHTLLGAKQPFSECSVLISSNLSIHPFLTSGHKERGISNYVTPSFKYLKILGMDRFPCHRTLPILKL